MASPGLGRQRSAMRTSCCCRQLDSGGSAAVLTGVFLLAFVVPGSFASRAVDGTLISVTAAAAGLPNLQARKLLQEAPRLQETPEASQPSPSSSSSSSSDSDSASSSSSGAGPGAWVFVVGFGSALLVVITVIALAVIFLCYKRKPTAVSPWRSGMSGHLQRPFETAVPLLKRAEVEVACEDFSNIIEETEETIVFKGTLVGAASGGSTGTEIAAASFKVPAASWNLQLELSFRRKVEALARMKHTHLVNLLAYCADDEEPRGEFARMLVFEYASNGSVFEHLHKKEEAAAEHHLDWPMRMRIVMGVAYGLNYMHHELVPAVAHLAFDAHSVFLTDDYSAKICNSWALKNLKTLPSPLPPSSSSSKSFWSRLPRRTRTEDSAVELHGRSSKQQQQQQQQQHVEGVDFGSNVYSFGVFLLEIVSGRPPQDEITAHSLVEWASEYLADPKMVWYMVDPSLKSYNHDELVALCRVAALCLSPKSRRPSMRRVVFMLAEVLGITPALAAPKTSALLWAQLELELEDDDGEEHNQADDEDGEEDP